MSLHLEGHWTRYLETVSEHNSLAEWTEQLYFWGRLAMLGDGTTAELQVRNGLVYLRNGLLVRVGDVLVRHGQSGSNSRLFYRPVTDDNTSVFSHEDSDAMSNVSWMSNPFHVFLNNFPEYHGPAVPDLETHDAASN